MVLLAYELIIIERIEKVKTCLRFQSKKYQKHEKKTKQYHSNYMFAKIRLFYSSHKVMGDSSAQPSSKAF